MTTLSYLVEAVRGEVDLPEDAGFRLELLSLEMTRLLDVIAHEIPGQQDAAAVVEVGLRSLAGQVTQLARVAHEAEVTLRPGPEVQILASPVLLWRVLTNVVDNAARAAGPAGQVEISVARLAGAPPRAALEVLDNGPGFGHGPPGVASLGLGVVTSLLESCGGSLEVQAPAGGGALVRIVIPASASPGGRPPGTPRDRRLGENTPAARLASPADDPERPPTSQVST
jgi:signal transduction histidine kinase